MSHGDRIDSGELPAPDDRTESTPPITVRTFTPADRAQVEHLFHRGLLPGHIDYEAREADQIRQTLGSGREHFWVAESQGRIIGTVAVVESGADVGHIHWLRVEPTWPATLEVARRLAKVAAGHAREVGFLKLALHAPVHAEERVTSYYTQLGFTFSRTREIDGRHELEFYLNLYELPEARAKPDAAKGGSAP